MYIKLVLIFLFLNAIPVVTQAAVKSVPGELLELDAQADGKVEMTINDGKIGVGLATPSANLHISGNTITDDLHVRQSIFKTVAIISDNHQITHESLIFADTSVNRIDAIGVA
jgi:hypothetical protein